VGNNQYADPVVIVLMGVAGSGKTTVGRALAAKLGWKFVDADDLHPAGNINKMRAGIALTDADRAPWLAAIHAVIALAIDRREHTVVACSALKAEYRDRMREGLRLVRFVYLKTPAAVLQHRLSERPSHFAGPSLLESQLLTLEEPSLDEALVVESTLPGEEILGAIRRDFGV
jgi:gluconokinase